MINTRKLSKELVAAGITTHGNCNSNGIVWDDENNQIQDRPDVAAVIAAHDPTPIITSRTVGKHKVSPDVADQIQVSVGGDWNSLPTQDKLDLLAKVAGLINSKGKIILLK